MFYKKVKNNDFDSLKHDINNADIISFDVFDTLLFRKVNTPEDIFKIVGSHSKIDSFTALRIQKQAECSMSLKNSKGYPHANFDEIYDYIKGTSQDDRNVDWDELKQLEYDIEKKLSVSNLEMKEIFEYAKQQGKKIIIVTDMYLSEEKIRDLLSIGGYSGFSKIYVSSEYRATKYEGDLFNHVIREEGVASSQILHIGDNYNSDIENARNKGLKVWHYSKSFVSDTNLDINNTVANALHFGICNNLLSCDKNETWYRLGVEIGGILYTGLIQWIMSQVKKDQIEEVYMLSRDGYILHNILEEMGLLKVKYLMTSRRALILPGITDIDSETLDLLPPYTFGQTIEEILLYIGMDMLSEEEIHNVGFKGKHDVISSHDDFRKMKLLYQNNKEYLLKIAEEERNAIMKYFWSIGINPTINKQYTFFDTGWNGSSQYLLERVFKALSWDIETNFLYLGILNTKKSEGQLENKKYSAYLFKPNINEHIMEIFKQAIIIPELFFSAPHASVWKYVYDNNEISILYNNMGEESWNNESFIKGIQDYVRDMFPLLEQYKTFIEPVDSASTLLRLISEPNHNEAAFIGDLYNLDGFTTIKNTKKYIAKANILSLIKNPNAEIYWYQGLFVRKDISTLVKILIKKLHNYKQSGNAIFKFRSRPKILSYIKVCFLRAYGMIKYEGITKFCKKVFNKLYHKNRIQEEYLLWIEENEKNHNEKISLNKFPYAPTISIIVPVYNVKKTYLSECINSVLNQSYPYWELCMADDASTWPEVKEVLKEYESKENVKITYRNTNGHIAQSTNTALDLATGEYVGFLDCDDILDKNALMEVVKVLNENRAYDFIYSDEDKISENGEVRHTPFFKPDWSPDTFMSIMYTCHFAVYRKSILDKIGRMAKGFDGAQDYEMTLRFTEQTNQIKHIPKILYHWREIAGSLAASTEAKPYAMEAMRRAKNEALERRGLTGKLVLVKDMAQFRVVYSTPNNPLVSIIIPTKNNTELVHQCIGSIRAITEYSNYEVILIDNGSDESNQIEYQSICKRYDCKYMFLDIEFNFSKLNNLATKEATGEYFLFLNDDTKIIQSSWINIMLGQAMLDHVGAVGAKLLYPDTAIIQHTGIANLAMGPVHAFIGADDKNIYYFGRNRLDWNCIAVTAACLLIEKGKFIEVGGFDEELGIAYNDVDLCFKLYEKGYFNVVRNDVLLYHYESFSRGSDCINIKKYRRLLNERELLCAKHNKLDVFDPFYNPNLSDKKVDYSLRIIGQNMDVSDCTNISKLNQSYNKFKNIEYDKKVEACIDSIDFISGSLIIKGWAFLKDKNTSRTHIMLRGQNGVNFLSSVKKYRPDVNNVFNLKITSYSGFESFIRHEDLEVDSDYQIGICVCNGSKKYGIWFDKYIHTN